jgi:hypothetical protein
MSTGTDAGRVAVLAAVALTPGLARQFYVSGVTLAMAAAALNGR